MVFLDDFKGEGTFNKIDFADKMYRWSDEAFYHLGLMPGYVDGGLKGLLAEGFGTFQEQPPAQQSTPLHEQEFEEPQPTRNLGGYVMHARRPGTIVNTFVLHHTGGHTAQDCMVTLKNRGLSVHFVLGKDGRVYNLVPVSLVALHAGRSVGPQGPNVNSYSVGVEMVNEGDAPRHPWTEAQYVAVIQLINEVKTKVPLKWITGHRDIAPGRKDDPHNFDEARVSRGTGLPWWKP